MANGAPEWKRRSLDEDPKLLEQPLGRLRAPFLRILPKQRRPPFSELF
jgi:hypothetical protein